MSTFSGSDIFEEAKPCGSGILEASNTSKSPKKMLAAEDLSDIVQNKLPTLQSQSDGPLKSIVVNAKEKPEDVTEDFITEFNKHRGNQEKVETARKMLKNTRLLAGLDPGSSYVDVPSARHNLFLLSGLCHQELKMAALKSLIEVLEADEIQRDSAFDLIVLAIDLMKQMNRELIQTQLIDEQVSICQAYGIVAELIQRHYAKKHLGGITKELKAELVRTTKTLEDLNTHDDPKLHFAAEFALQGIIRLRDDRKELFEFFERVIHLLMAAAAYAGDDPKLFANSVKNAISGIDFEMANSWYDVAMLFNEIAKKAMTEHNKIILMQYLISQVPSKDWKFTYNAIEKLGRIALNSSSRELRSIAFQGLPLHNGRNPGIIDFIDCHSFSPKTDFGPLVNFKAPVLKDKNLPIRMLCIELLVKIARESPDVQLRKQAKEILCLRVKKEDNPCILEAITTVVPKKSSHKKLWIKEEGVYAHKPANAHTEKKNNNEIQSIATHHLHLTSETNVPDNVSTAPSRVSLILGNCLGIDPHHIQLYFHPGKDIHLNEAQQLQINLEGMKKIGEFIKKNKTIKAIDFSHCKIEDSALGHLSACLSSWNIYLLRLPPLSTKLCLTFASALNAKLNISFDSPRHELLFGVALMHVHKPVEALEYFMMAYQKIEDNEDHVKLKASLLYQIGRTSLSLGHAENGELALLKSLKLQPKSYKPHLLLSTYYKAQNKLAEARYHAEMAEALKQSSKNI